jgi:hypothetical protein
MQVLIDGSTGNEQCLQNARDSWSRDLVNVAVGISQCAAQSIEPINNATDDFHRFLREQNQIAFQVQNSIVNAFAEVRKLKLIQF